MPNSLLRPRPNSPLNIVWLEGNLSAESCREIITYGEQLPPLAADMTGPQAAQARQSTISWFPLGTETAAVYRHLRPAVQQINEQHFGFDLVGFGEAIQFAQYEPNNGHYEWHIDAGPGSTSLRKLSVIIQLSDSSEYEGGDVEFQAPGPIRRIPRSRGTMVVFSPFLLHRVTPVTRGKRMSLVAWVTGPPFR